MLSVYLQRLNTYGHYLSSVLLLSLLHREVPGQVQLYCQAVVGIRNLQYLITTGYRKASPRGSGEKGLMHSTLPSATV